MQRHQYGKAWLVACALCAAGTPAPANSSKQPAPAKAAATPNQAVERLIQSIKPLEAKDQASNTAELVSFCKEVLPHLSKPSQEMISTLLETLKEAKAHDADARKKFGKALEQEKNYIPAEAAVGLLAAMGFPLANVPPGSKGKVIKQSAKSPSEVVFRVRWSKADGAMVESVAEVLVAVKELAGWKVLVPGFHDVQHGVQQSVGSLESYVKRKETEWHGKSVREHNAVTKKNLEALRAKIERSGRDLKDGKFPDARAYIKAIGALGDEK